MYPFATDNYPEELLYLEKGSEQDALHDTPPGELDLSQAIQNLPCWKRRKTNSSLQPKTIVFNCNLTGLGEISHHTHWYIQIMLIDGFSFVLPQSGDLVLLRPWSRYSLDLLRSVVKSKKDTLWEKINKKFPELNKNNTFIMSTSYWLNVTNISFPQTILYQEIFAFPPFLHNRRTHSTIAQMEVDELPPSKHLMVRKILTEEIPISAFPKIKVLDVHSCMRYLRNQDAEELAQIQSLTLQINDASDADLKAVEYVLQKATNAISIYVFSKQKVSINFQDIPHNTETLFLENLSISVFLKNRKFKSLNFVDCDIANACIPDIAQSSIQYLSFQNPSFVSDTNLVPHSSTIRSETKALIIFDCADRNFLSYILNACKDIRTVILSKCMLPDPGFSSPAKKLRLNDIQHVSESFFQGFFQLKLLELDKVQIESRKRQALNKSALYSLRISNSIIPPGPLQRLLHGENMKDLSLAYVKTNADSLKLPPNLYLLDVLGIQLVPTFLQNKSIKELKFDLPPKEYQQDKPIFAQSIGIKIPPASEGGVEKLSVFLQNTHFPNLSSLKLTFFETASGHDFHFLSHTPQIQRLFLINARTLSIQQFKTILDCLPHLQSLALENLDQIQFANEPEANYPDFSGMDFFITNSKISLTELTKLTLNTRRFNSLFLTSCDQISRHVFSKNYLPQWAGHVGFTSIANKSRNDLLLFKQIMDRTNIDVSDFMRPSVASTSIAPNLVQNSAPMPMFSPSRTPVTPNRFSYKKPSGLDLSQKTFLLQLSQFIELTNQERAWIPKIQKGICAAMCSFVEKHVQNWKEISDLIYQWDGTAISLTPERTDLLQQLYNTYKQHYQSDSTSRASLHPLVDALGTFLKMTQAQSFSFHNFSHQIFLKRINRNQTFFYDPNDPCAGRNINRADEETYIRDALGGNIWLVKKRCRNLPVPMISNLERFYLDGGLLGLSFCEALLDHLQPLLPKTETINAGLTALNIDDTPAWLELLKHPSEPLTHFLGRLFTKAIALAPEKTFNALKKSIAHLNLNEINVLVRQNITNNPHYHETIQAFFELLCERDQYFIPIVLPATEQDEHHELPHQLIPELLKAGKNLLLVVKSNASIEAVVLEATKQTDTFFIKHPDEIRCQAPWLFPEGDGALTLKPGPGGALFDFLNQHHQQEKPALLLIDCSAWNVQEKSLLQLEHMDNVSIPKEMRIIVFDKKSSGQSPAFLQLFDRTILYTPNEIAIKVALPALPFIDEGPICNHADQTPPVPIHFFEDSFESVLFGSRVMRDAALRFETSPFIDALLEGCLEFVFYNAPETDPRYLSAWRKIINEGKITLLDGRAVPVSLDISIIHKMDNNWLHIKSAFKWNPDRPPHAIALNPASFYPMFAQYNISNVDETLSTEAGQIQKHAGEELDIVLTRPIGDVDWYQLLSECKKHETTLSCYGTKDFPLPSHLDAIRHNTRCDETVDMSMVDLTRAEICVTNDANVFIDDLLKCNPEAIVIDMSGKTSRQLFEYTDVTQENCGLKFFQQAQIIPKFLADNKTVILTGTPSDEVLDALSSLVVSRSYDGTQGRLHVVSITPIMDWLPSIEVIISCEQKKAFLEQRYPLDLINQLSTEQIQIHPTYHLEAYLKQALIDNIPPDEVDPWQGMKSIPANPETLEIDFERTAECAELFQSARAQAIHTMTSNSRFGTVIGASGAGKTSSIKTFFQPNPTCFWGIDQIDVWANTEPVGEQPVVLLLDEITLETPNCLESLEAMMRPMPHHVDAKGDYIALSPYHCVYCMGNPVASGYGERTLPAFIERHGVAIIFSPIPPEVIYEDCIKPILIDALPQDSIQTIAQIWLKSYQFLCSISCEEILMTPREVEAMSYMMLANIQGHESQQELSHLATEILYLVVNTLIPDYYRMQFEECFGQLELKTQSLLVEDESQRILRHQNCVTVEHVLQLREMLIHTPIQSYGGLRGALLEGQQNTARIFSTLQMLKKHAYHETALFSDLIQEKSYCILSPSLPLSQKREALLWAFHKGIITLMPRMNMTSGIESLLNALLMGTTPDNQVPEQPGFMLIATASQEPSCLEVSTALKRRMLSTKSNTFEKRELEQLFESMDISPLHIENVLDDFISLSAKAVHQNQSPPTHQNLLQSVYNVDLLYKTLQRLEPVGNCSKDLTTPTFRGLSAESIDPADKPRGVGCEVNCQQTLGNALQEELSPETQGMTVNVPERLRFFATASASRRGAMETPVLPSCSNPQGQAR